MRRFLMVLVVMSCCGSMRAVAQEAHRPQATDAARPTHGIIRKPQPKPTAEAAKPAPSAEPAKTEVGKTDAGKSPAPAHAAPAASTEAVAAAIANAVRSLEEKERKKPEPVPAQPARAGRPAVPRAVAQRRYSVTWPNQRFEVQWAAPVDRIEISWGEQD